MNNDNNNEQNNNFNIHSAIDESAFNIFNQNPSPQPTVSQPTNNPASAPAAAPTPVPPQPTKAAPTQNMVTVNDYKEPKKPFNLKDLLKKKMEEEEKTFRIDDITNFKDTTVREDPEEVKEKKKKKKDLIVLIFALIALVVACFIAYRVFSNYLLPSQNIIDSNTINRNINSTNVINDDSDIINYNCNYMADDNFYNFPAKDYINWELYKGSSTYSFLNDKLDIITENIDLNYFYMDDATTKIVVSYCNKYNKILDEYQFLCRFTNNHLLITNTFYLNKIDSNINNFLGNYSLRYNKNSILGDLITNDNSCVIAK